MNISINKDSSIAIYEQIKEELHRYIIDNGMQQGDALPSLQEIASEAGVSLKTAERALNLLIEQGVCYRKPKRGTFVGRTGPEQLHLCGIFHKSRVASFERDVIESDILRGINDRSTESSTDLFYITGDPEERLRFYMSNPAAKLEAVFMFHWQELDEGRRLAEKFPQLPFIYLNYYSSGFESMPDNVYGVFNDDSAGAYQMVNYMLDRGHTRIAFFMNEVKDENYIQRRIGYEQALRARGIACDSNWIFARKPSPMKITNNGDDITFVGKEMMRDCLNQKNAPTAVVCCNDLLATGACQMLEECGKRSEIEVAGYDNVYLHLGRNNNFPTMAIDFYRIGTQAMAMAENLGSQPYPKVLRIAPYLVAAREKAYS